MNQLATRDDRLKRAKCQFLDGQDLPKGLLSRTVERSWLRSREFGLHPGSAPQFDAVDSFVGRVAHDVLIQAAMPEMSQLHQSLNNPDWIVLCTDTAGTIIRTLSDPRAPKEISNSLRTGRTVQENCIGSNAQACVLAERKPVVMRGPEHFLADLSGYVCVAAPIFGVDGSLAGVLDVTGLAPASARFLREHVALSARAIENRMFGALPEVRLLSVHVMRSFLGTAAEGILAVSEIDGSVAAVSEAACAMLEAQRGALIGKTLDQIFEQLPTRNFAEVGEKVVRTTSGRRIFVREHMRRPVRQINSAPINSSRAVGPAISATVDPTVERAMEIGRRAISNGLPLLILGETGSGKEIAARSIHASGGAERPFVAVNCAALPESLMEAELFGYADGAFTGGRKGGVAGAFEAANGGTLFLDEVGDAPLTLQSKLLRVIQEGAVCRLGSRREIKLNVSIMSATHRDLGQLMREGTFREDLYYRLNGLTIKLPALRERADKGTLIDTLLAKLSDGRPPELTPSARRAIIGYPWPGNIRQLAQALKAAWVMSSEPSLIDVDDLPADIFTPGAPPCNMIAPTPTDLTVKETTVWLAHKAMKDSDNNASEAARRLRISRTTLYKYLKKDLASEQFE